MRLRTGDYKIRTPAPPVPVVTDLAPLTPADADRFFASGGQTSTAFTSATPLPAAPSDAHRSPSLTQDESLPVATEQGLCFNVQTLFFV